MLYLEHNPELLSHTILSEPLIILEYLFCYALIPSEKVKVSFYVTKWPDYVDLQQYLQDWCKFCGQSEEFWYFLWAEWELPELYNW